MIKISFCLKRLPSLTRQEFQDYWLTRHAPLVRSHAATLNIRRYVQSHSLSPDHYAALAASRGSEGDDFDGVAELWWDSLERLAAATATPEGMAAGLALLEDERRFIDLPNSPIFLVEEHEIIALS